MRCKLVSACFLAVTYFSGANTFAAAPNACPIKEKLSEPTAFLIDKNNNIVNGPVDFGTFETKENFATDYMVKKTQYKLVLFPARIDIRTTECNFCISAKKINPICPNSSTFEIGVGLVFKGLPGSKSPDISDEKFDFDFTDKKLGYDPHVKLEFDSRIVGTLITKK